jgi:hypothetical protein
LQALNGLAFVERDHARMVLPAIHRIAEVDNEYLHDAGMYLELVLNGTYQPEIITYDPKFGARRVQD